VLCGLWAEGLARPVSALYDSARIGGLLAGRHAVRVRDCINGGQFQLGDPQNLRRVLLETIEDSSQLSTMSLEAPEVPMIEAQCRLVREHYSNLLH